MKHEMVSGASRRSFSCALERKEQIWTIFKESTNGNGQESSSSLLLWPHSVPFQPPTIFCYCFFFSLFFHSVICALRSAYSMRRLMLCRGQQRGNGKYHRRTDFYSIHWLVTSTWNSFSKSVDFPLPTGCICVFYSYYPRVDGPFLIELLCSHTHDWSCLQKMYRTNAERIISFFIVFFSLSFPFSSFIIIFFSCHISIVERMCSHFIVVRYKRQVRRRIYSSQYGNYFVCECCMHQCIK